MASATGHGSSRAQLQRYCTHTPRGGEMAHGENQQNSLAMCANACERHLKG